MCGIWDTGMNLTEDQQHRRNISHKMIHHYKQSGGPGRLNLIRDEDRFERFYHQPEAALNYYTIAWNRGGDQQVMADEVNYRFPANQLLPLMMSQSFRFERPEDIIAWQFNRDFYCIVNHDAEVGCAGFLFYGPSPMMFISLDEEQTRGMNRLLDLFEEEFRSDEDIKSEMLRMLLVRLIIQVTRLAKKQYLGHTDEAEEKFYLLRQFNLLVEIHFRTQHQVKFYAGQLNKSPKTISNLFSQYSKKTPLRIIHDRIIGEARRLLYYSDKSIKEIASQLGFEDVAHFSRFFKKSAGINASDIKRIVKRPA